MNTQKAIELCRTLEAIASRHGGHVALTGGCLYKSGERGDCDIIIYRHDCDIPVNFNAMVDALHSLGFKLTLNFGRVRKFVSPDGSLIDMIDANGLKN